MSSSQSSSQGRIRGPWSSNFQQHLVDNDVYPHAYRYPDRSVPAKPNNWEEINHLLAHPRPSLSEFTHEEYEIFVQADADASKENQVSESVVPIIEGKISDGNCRAGGIPFTNLDPLTDGTLKPGKPDIYHGARAEQLSRKVRDQLGGQIILSTQDNLPIAPNFFLAAKGLDGSASVAKRQCCYNGALGARGMHSLQSYGQGEPVYDNNASTITSIYHNGQLQMYTSHLAQPKSPGGSPEYHMTRLRSFAMTDTADTCRDGLRAYRNGREWCREQRDNAINRANERAKGSTSSNVTTEQSETWSWTNGKFQGHKGQDLMKEQHETPVDVWVYFDEGWPDQGGKKWKWISATGEILFA